jgi:hypothetical protein
VSAQGCTGDLVRIIGADMIVLRPCYSCGEWPHLHKPGCPVQVARDQEYRRVAEQMADALRSRTCR